MKNFYYKEDSISKIFATSLNASPFEKIDFLKNSEKFKGSTLILRGLRDKEIINLCYKQNIDFLFIDTGYIGNFKDKVWHRIVKNNVLHSKINKTNFEKVKKFNLFLKKNNIRKDAFIQNKKNGDNILFCPITKKTAGYFNINKDDWTEDVLKKIKKRTDRKIIIREKPLKRSDRLNENSIYSDLEKNIHVLITFNSITAVESVLYGIPAIALGQNAASPVCSFSLDDIENPFFPDKKLKEAWFNGLLSHQFSKEEMKNGLAKKQLGY